MVKLKTILQSKKKGSILIFIFAWEIEVRTQMKRIAVLITCYNRVNTTLRCLQKLFAQTNLNDYSLDVWLVDDASPDGTGEKVKKAFPQVNMIQSNGGLFWCKGMHLAWSKAANNYDYDFYLWLNDDVILKEDSIYHILNDYDICQSVVVGTFASDYSETDVSYGATRTLPNDSFPQKGTSGMNGNCVLVPRDVYLKVGKICSKYHHQYGDYDYGWQLRKKGFEYYSSSRILGVCPQEPNRYFHLKGVSFWGRIKLLFNPKGYSLHDAFLYKKRNWGLFRAVLSVVHITVRVVLGLE